MPSLQSRKFFFEEGEYLVPLQIQILKYSPPKAVKPKGQLLVSTHTGVCLIECFPTSKFQRSNLP